MYVALQVATIVSVAVAMGLSLAHVLELPGKLRLNKEEYLATQRIYYPGFTLGGFSEPLAVLLTLLLIVFTPVATAPFWLSMAALVLLAAMHGAYWLLTHPVNNFWLVGVDLSQGSARFFRTHQEAKAVHQRKSEWRRLRARWEFSHVVRAGLGLSGLLLVAIAAAL